MSQKSESLVVEEKTAELVDSVPTSEVEVKVAEQETIGKTISGLSWAPLENEALEAHGEEIISGIMERIPNLSVKTSPNNHQSLSFGTGRGRGVAKFWFTKKRIVLETAELVGRKYSVLASRDIDEKTGLSSKVRAKVVSEIRAYISARNWK